MAKLGDCQIEERTLTIQVAVTFAWWARVCFAVAMWLLRLAGTHGIRGKCAEKTFPLFKSVS